MNAKEYKDDYNNLKKLINDWYKKNDYQKKKINIKEDLENFTFKHDKNYYKDKIFFSKNKNVIDELNLIIEFCNDNEELCDIWNYLQFMSSSHTISENNIRIIKILLKDLNTNKYLGILELSADFYNLGDRDKYIEWTEEIKKNKIKYIICLSTCVGLQPISHNLNIGKLLSVIVFSKEIQEYFYNKFGYYYVAVSTTSLFGKSIQYDRLKELKLIGYTKGYGVSQIPDYLYIEMTNFMKKYYLNEYKNINNSKKIRKISFISRLFEYKDKLIFHGHKRGIYFGYINDQSKDFLRDINDQFNINNLRTVNEIINWWKERWARNRWNNLFINNKIKLGFDLKNMTAKERFNEYIKQYTYDNYHFNKDFKDKIINKNKNFYYKNKSIKDKRILNFIEIIQIMEWKEKKNNNEKFFDNKIISHKKLSLFLSKEFNKNISEQMIKYYWNGTVKLIEKEFIEYYKNNYLQEYNKYINLLKL
jgi:hypothetical protein